MKRLPLAAKNRRHNWPAVFFGLKLLLAIGLGTVAGAAHSSFASAQTAPFPGMLLTEGTAAGISPGADLIYLGDHRILSWAATSNQYHIWRYDPELAGPVGVFPGQSLTEGVWNVAGPDDRLTYLGDSRLLAWEPRIGQYKVQQYHLDPSRRANLLSAQSIAEGTLEPSIFDRRLIHLEANRVLVWEPATGRYQFWRYNPALTRTTNSFPGEPVAAGIWPTIRTGHELLYLGYRRLLDWEPATGQYRIWRYDPMVAGNNNPLVGDPVAEGVFDTIRAGHQLISLDDNHLLDWQPQTGQYRLWRFELMAIGALAVDDVAAKLAGQTITGVTVITHGFQSSDSFGDSLLPLAQDIHQKAGGWLLDYDVDGNGSPFFDTCTNDCGAPAPGEGGTRELVLLFDWAAGSNEHSSGWGEAAGDALFNLLVGINLLAPAASANPPYHLIGHSFGAAVTAELVERLAYFAIPVDHLTLLDPHDFDQNIYGVDTAQRLFDLGKPFGYGATVWNNVIFADVYYQTRGQPTGTPIPVPDGRPIPGAYNKLLLNELPGNPGGYPIGSSDHSYVWTCFYRATVTGALPAGCLSPLVSPDYSQTGYAFSRIKHTASRPGANFYSPGQDHKYSEPKIVDTITGQPNLSGLAELDLSVAQITQGHWRPDWLPFAITNGDFEHFNALKWDGDDLIGIPFPVICINVIGENSCPQAGWAYHGGGGDGHFTQAGSNTYLQLDWANTAHTHNSLYVPPGATGFQFDLRRQDGPEEPDQFEVLLGDQVIFSETLTEGGEDGDFITRHIPLPPSFLGQTATITFRFSTPVELLDGSTVWIDNVHFVGPTTTIYLPIMLR